MLQGLGRLWLSGLSVDWARLHAPAQPRRVSLPAYPFERRRHWVEAQRPSSREQGSSLPSASSEPAELHPRPEDGEGWVSPRSDLEREVAALWQRLLGIAKVGAADGNSVVDLHTPEHIAQVRRVFRAANDRRMAIVAHVRASVTAKLPWGREEAAIFLNELLPAAPDVVVQVAHLASAGSAQDEGAQQALEVFVDAVARNDPRTRHLYFDATTVGEPPTPENARRWATAIRRVPTRVLFGSDATTAVATPGAAWTAMRKLLPLTEDEFKGLANNTPPYLH